jgi:hypothetical protein
MGREIRRVPADWRHPHDAAGKPIPLHAADFARIAAAWDCGQAKWERGFIATHSTLPGVPAWRPRDEFVRARDYLEHAGPRPRDDCFMPAWPDEQRTWWQMYETVTAGTPISPPRDSAKALARWLADHHASAGPDILATEKEWLAMITGPRSSALFLAPRGVITSALSLKR